MKLRRSAILIATFTMLSVAIMPTASNAASADSMEDLPEYPALEALMNPDAGPQEIEFSIEAGSYRGPDGERITIAKSATYTCLLTVDNPHWSTGAQSVIAKPRVSCKGPSSTIPIRVYSMLGKTAVNSIPSMTIVAESDYVQNVVVTSGLAFGSTTTWYVPAQNSSTKVSRGAYFRGGASAAPSAPVLPFNIPSAASQFLYVP